MALQALIFDVDGTLAETEELHRISFNQAFARIDLAWTWTHAIYAALLEVTGGKERIAHFIATHHATPVLDARAIADLHLIKTAIYTKSVSRGAIGLRPGIRRLMAEAQQQAVAIAIATTTSRDSVNALLLASFGPDALRRFAHIAAADSVSAKKPAPDVYTLVLKRLGLDARDTIAIEDTPNGLRSAKGAGIDVLITRSTFGGESGFEDALAVVDHLGDPGNPCRVLRGSNIVAGMVTLAGLRQMQRLSAGGKVP